MDYQRKKMKEKKKERIRCIRCGKKATTTIPPASCDTCREVIMTWLASSITIPEEFTTRLRKWESRATARKLGLKYERISINEYDIKVGEYTQLVEALEFALKKESEVVIFKTYIFSTKEINKFVAGCEKNQR